MISIDENAMRLSIRRTDGQADKVIALSPRNSFFSLSGRERVGTRREKNGQKKKTGTPEGPHRVIMYDTLNGGYGDAAARVSRNPESRDWLMQPSCEFARSANAGSVPDRLGSPKSRRHFARTIRNRIAHSCYVSVRVCLRLEFLNISATPVGAR